MKRLYGKQKKIVDAMKDCLAEDDLNFHDLVFYVSKKVSPTIPAEINAAMRSSNLFVERYEEGVGYVVSMNKQ